MLRDMTKLCRAALDRAIKQAGGQSALAKLMKISPQFMGQIANGKRPLPPRKAVMCEQATGVGRRELFPDDWQSIWPELAGGALLASREA